LQQVLPPLEKLSSAWTTPGDKKRGQDQQLSTGPGWRSPSRGCAVSTHEVTEQPPPLSHGSLVRTSPSSRRHPQRTGCKGRAGSRLAWWAAM